MHLIETLSGITMLRTATARPPCGAGFSADTVDTANTLEIWGSDFDEAGNDYCLFVLKNNNGLEIARKRVEGY